MTGRLAGKTWETDLRGFSDRNVNRKTVLELDETELGVQRQVTNWSLQGVTYDRREGAVEMMLDAGQAGHLTHTVHGVREINVLPASDGHGEVLRIQHDNGQVLLHVQDSLAAARGRE